MRTDATTTATFNKQEPIPGYVTKELLGAGGYGEVWKTNAPGGLMKAVKFVYADLNSKRASREMRSLNRIKEVRHPFLLSIERIEVIDGNVVIVTELADHSLKQHYQKLRANGQLGIPRDELLGYLRDTADALDYIYENYSLQHLDIKPENLLLIGNRAKVADFGLIKNLYDRSASMIEGLTPIYAPPELFEGKPNRNSDQYSLAIVYQEMLVGELPFDGTTAARLAAQHLHTAPNLAALPKYDQPVIARALSKDPDQRFHSCRALVEALAEAGKSKQAARHEPVVRDVANNATADVEVKTEPILEGSLPLEGEAGEGTAARPQDRTPIDVNAGGPVQYSPVLFIGIGGSATRIFRRLHRRLHDRLGAMEDVPAIEMLVIDTDVKSLNRATEGEPGTALLASETLGMPLRRTEEYRSAANNILTSISRRWLYNLPFSLQTEGFRPLGRLALVDHSKRLAARLRQALTNITSQENLDKTTSATGLAFSSPQPRVFIVASTSGATGGGMVLDVAYTVRTILKSMDLPDTHVDGILLHVSPRGASERDKAVANSYATLSEFWHYSRPGHFYPGDRGCGLPPFHGNNRTFSSCYFVHLGDDLTDPQFDSAVDPVAEYLYAGAVTPAVRFFEQCRHADQSLADSELGEPTVRTFGLCQLGGSNSNIPAIAAEVLCRDLVSNWRSGLTEEVERATPRLSETMALIAAHSGAKTSRFADVEEQCSARAGQLELNVERMTEIAREILDQEVSTNVEEYFAKLIAEAFVATTGDVEQNDVTRVFNIIDSVLGGGANEEGSSDAGFDSLNTVLNTRLDARAGKLAAGICDWILDLVDTADGVEGAKHSAQWFHKLLRSMQSTSHGSVGVLRQQTMALQEAILHQWDAEVIEATGKKPDARMARETQLRMLDYARIRAELVVALAVTRWLRLVEARLTAVHDRLQEFWKDLNGLADAFQVPRSFEEAFENSAASDIIPSHWRGLLDQLMERRHELVATLDRDITERLEVGPSKLRWYLTQGAPANPQLATPLRAAARQLVLSAMQALNVSRLSAQCPAAAEPDTSEYRRCIEASRARMADSSSESRLLLIVPDDIDEAKIRENVSTEEQQPMTIVRSSGGDFVACQEVGSLDVRKLAARLVDNRKDYVEIAKRLHTRIDVKWEDMDNPSPRCK
jgi:eukaryotic-like serine/threonine-protein kinase